LYDVVVQVALTRPGGVRASVYAAAAGPVVYAHPIWRVWRTRYSIFPGTGDGDRREAGRLHRDAADLLRRTMGNIRKKGLRRPRVWSAMQRRGVEEATASKICEEIS
jgi:DNA polymerase III alpha subunit